MTREGLQRSCANDPNHVLVREAKAGKEYTPSDMVEFPDLDLCVPASLAEGMMGVPQSSEVQAHEDAATRAAEVAMQGAVEVHA